jgi:general secretion pathway protein A
MKYTKYQRSEFHRDDPNHPNHQNQISMYENFYGFKEKPFQIVPDPDCLYKSPKHQNALTYLEYGLAENVGFILLTGEIGSGKTTLIQYVLNKLVDNTEVAVIFNTNVSADQLLLMILNEFALPSENFDKPQALDALNQFLIQNYAENRKVLLIIDEAQNLSAAALEEVRMLSNLHSEDRALLQIMLVGQPELINTLRKPNLMQFSQRIAVNFHLEGLDREETAEYIAFRLENAGGRKDIFTAEALDMIYQLAGGIPRSINLLCQAALVYGFADGAQSIDKPIIDQITADKIGVGLEITTRPGQKDNPTGSADTIPPGVLERLSSLEAEVRKVRLLLDNQLQDLAGKAAGFKDDLAGKLTQLLVAERNRNADLIRENTQLKLHYKTLQRIRARLEQQLNGMLQKLNTGNPSDEK